MTSRTAQRADSRAVRRALDYPPPEVVSREESRSPKILGENPRGRRRQLLCPRSKSALPRSKLNSPISRPQVGGAPTEVLASRRDFAKKAALGVAGAVAGGTALALTGATPAFAAHQPEDLGLGIANTTAGLTRVDSSGSGGTAFLFQSGSVFTNTDASFPAALSAWATTAAIPHGLYAFTTQANAYAVVGYGAGAATVGGYFYGNRAQLSLIGLGGVPAGAHTLGDIYQQTDGTLWACVASGTPGTFRKLAGTTTAGQLHLVTPGRVYDSRADAAGKHTFGAADRVVTCTTVIAGQPAAGTVIVPAGATGILGNLTVTATESAGFLGLYSNAVATWPGNSSINWVAANVDLANAVTVAIDATGKIKVNIGGQGVSTKTHFIIDVVGYYA